MAATTCAGAAAAQDEAGQHERRGGGNGGGGVVPPPPRERVGGHVLRQRALYAAASTQQLTHRAPALASRAEGRPVGVYTRSVRRAAGRHQARHRGRHAHAAEAQHGEAGVGVHGAWVHGAAVTRRHVHDRCARRIVQHHHLAPLQPVRRLQHCQACAQARLQRRHLGAGRRRRHGYHRAHRHRHRVHKRHARRRRHGAHERVVRLQVRRQALQQLAGAQEEHDVGGPRRHLAVCHLLAGTAGSGDSSSTASRSVRARCSRRSCCRRRLVAVRLLLLHALPLLVLGARLRRRRGVAEHVLQVLQVLRRRLAVKPHAHAVHRLQHAGVVHLLGGHHQLGKRQAQVAGQALRQPKVQQHGDPVVVLLLGGGGGRGGGGVHPTPARRALRRRNAADARVVRVGRVGAQQHAAAHDHDVAGVRVAVEAAVAVDLVRVCLHDAVHQLLPVHAQPHQARQVVHLGAVNEAHDEDAGGEEARDDARHGDRQVGLHQVVAHLRHVGGLLQEVQLAAHLLHPL